MCPTMIAALQMFAIVLLSLCSFAQALPCPDSPGTCPSLSIPLLRSIFRVNQIASCQRRNDGWEVPGFAVNTDGTYQKKRQRQSGRFSPALPVQVLI